MVPIWTDKQHLQHKCLKVTEDAAVRLRKQWEGALIITIMVEGK